VLLCIALALTTAIVTGQLARDIDAAHRLLQRHLKRTLPATSAVVLNRNNSADRLEAVTPLPPFTSPSARAGTASSQPRPPSAAAPDTPAHTPADIGPAPVAAPANGGPSPCS
jgi:hypothetical protein